MSNGIRKVGKTIRRVSRAYARFYGKQNRLFRGALSVTIGQPRVRSSRLKVAQRRK